MAPTDTRTANSGIYKKRGRPSSDPPATPLATLRAEHGLTLTQLADLTGIDVGAWSQLERGLLAPQPKHTEAVAAVFGGRWRIRFVLERETPA